MGKHNEITAGYTLSDDQVKDAYFLWLTDLVRRDGFYILLKQLYETNFTWFVPNDENRALDTETLKDEFVEEQGLGFYEYTVISDRYSVLEVLIGISDRIFDNMEEYKTMKDWFWELIYNLGLDVYTDYKWDTNHKYEVESIINRMMDRHYTPDGFGGLFPLTDTDVDQRKIEIWYQMNEYLREKYHVEY